MHCGFICVEGANPQHQLDYQALEEAKLPEGLTLIIGTIDTKASTVETKELIAERLLRVASVVNPQNLIAGTDCGFATFEGSGYTHLAPAAVPLKMKALVRRTTSAPLPDTISDQYDQIGFPGPPEPARTNQQPNSPRTEPLRSPWRHLTGSLRRTSTLLSADINEATASDGQEQKPEHPRIGSLYVPARLAACLVR